MKAKGSRNERELVHMFNDTNLWSAVRIAGSGLTSDPNPDVLAGNKQRYLAIECKSLKNSIKYLYPEEIDQIVNFSSRFGAEPWIAVKFNNKGWFFLKPEFLEKTKSDNYSVSLLLAKEKGLSFEQLILSQNGN
ncbi:Holliday junction resolvase [Candidatus Woesearchaeota archaeon]|nr:Holliday junction resolvase [Candidatus Woesearchaeota archaeon]